MTMQSMFRIDLDVFQGPLDLLYYLVRKNELDILNVPVAVITEQYLTYLELLETLDINVIGDFIALASMLVEMKSFEVLPNDELPPLAEFEDPRKELVKSLLAYKKICDKATELEKRGRLWQLRFPRLSSDLPPKQKNLAEEPIKQVELWDLVSAFGRIIRENTAVFQPKIVYDDTPISTHLKRIYTRVMAEGKVNFRDFFLPTQHKSTMIGVFLAILELIRHEYVDAQQDELFGDIQISLRAGSSGNKPIHLISQNETY